MPYLCLVAVDAQAWNKLSAAEKEAIDRASIAYDEELKAAGHLLAAHALQPTRTAMTVRVRAGDPSFTDGPYVETKEHICGFLLIEARDLNEAVRIASKVPMATVGTIEVRATMDIDIPKRP